MSAITYTIDSFGAVGDGLTNDSAAFTAFNTAALSWQSTNIGTVTLLLTAGKQYACVQSGLQVLPAASIKIFIADGDSANTGNPAALLDKIRLITTATTTSSPVLTFASVPAAIFVNMPVSGTGITSGAQVSNKSATTVTLNTSVTVASGTTIAFQGGGFFLGGHGIVEQSLNAPSSQSCRIATVVAGSSSVTLLDASKTSIFNVGSWIMVSGIDLQGYGNPPNPYYKEFHQIAGASGTTITLDAPLIYSYKSTWPNYSNTEAPDPGGPGTIYRLTDDWSINATWRNMIIDGTNQVYSSALGMTFNNVSAPDGALIPTVNRDYTCNNVTMASFIEVDKCLTNLTYNNCTLQRGIEFQSSSVDNFVITNTTVSNFFNGIGKSGVLNNVTILPGLTVGVASYGQTSKAVLTNCNISSFVGSNGPLSGTLFANVLANGIKFAAGIIQWPLSFTIPTTQVSLSGTSTVTFPNNAFDWASVIQAGGLRIRNITNPAATPFPFPTISSGTGGVLTLSAPFAQTVQIGDQFVIDVLNFPPAWAVPDYWYTFFGQYNYVSPTAFQIGDLSRGSITQGTGVIDAILISTTLQGSNWPGISFVTDFGIKGQSCPEFTATGCFGCAQALDVSTAPHNTPLWNYSQRGYSGNIGTGQEIIPVYGRLVSATFNITTPYTGVRSTLPFDLGGSTCHVIETVGFSVTTWPISIDLKSGPRIVVVTPTSVTGNVGTDGGISPPGAILLVNSEIKPRVVSDISGENPSVYPAITLTIVTYQDIPIFAATRNVSLPYNATVAIRLGP